MRGRRWCKGNQIKRNETYIRMYVEREREREEHIRTMKRACAWWCNVEKGQSAKKRKGKETDDNASDIGGEGERNRKVVWYVFCYVSLKMHGELQREGTNDVFCREDLSTNLSTHKHTHIRQCMYACLRSASVYIFFPTTSTPLPFVYAEVKPL